VEIEQPTVKALAKALHNDTGKFQLFTLTNKHNTTLTATNFGATVLSLIIKDKEGNGRDIVLGYDEPAAYENDECYFGSVVGRYANRIGGEEITVNDERYMIAVREGGYHLHGGKVGFNKKFFTAATFEENGKMGIVFRYTSSHLEEGFPGELQLEVTYTLDDDNAWTVEYRATTNQATVLNLTQHTYFNLSGDPTVSIYDHSVLIPAQYYLPVNASQVPNGAIVTVTNTPFDFTTFKQIGKDANEENEQLKLSAGYDHSFVLEKQHTNNLKHAATVKHKSGVQLDVYTTEPAVHFYAGNFLENVKGKNGITYQKHAGLCLETQHFPDSPNNPHFPTTQLNPGEMFYSKTVFKFSAA